MIPTTRLRFVNRQINGETYRILQQQWADTANDKYEWRDVPTEDENG